MPKFSESPWVPMLLSTGIILSAFAGITYVLVNKLEPSLAQASPAEHGNVPAEHSNVPAEHSNVPAEHGNVPAEHGNVPAEHGNVPAEHDHAHEASPNTHLPERAPVALAASSIRQSPIDLVSDRALSPTGLGPVHFRYTDGTYVLKNIGHTIRVDCKASNGIVINGHHYTLKYFEFHARSEHLVDGRDYAMEIQLVHEISDQAPEDLPPTVAASRPPPKSLAIIGVMIKEGQRNALIQNLWTEFPNETDAPVRYILKGHNAATFLPPAGKRSYFRYNGSLTTPPYTENVLWTVMTEPIEFSKDQIDAFTHRFPKSNRPVQTAHQRFVLQYRDQVDAVPASPPIQPTQPAQPSTPSQPTQPPPAVGGPTALPPAQPVEPIPPIIPPSLKQPPTLSPRPQPAPSQPAPPTPIQGNPIKTPLSFLD